MAPENQGLARSQLPDRETWLKTLGGVFTRVVLFAIEGTNAKVTGVRGLSDLLVGTTTSLAEQTPLRWAVEAASPIVGAGRSPSGELMAKMLKLAVPRAFAVVPLVYGKKLAGLAYGDRGNQALPLASVSEVFAACEKLLNPATHDRSALPDKGSLKSTARRDSRDARGNRRPKPRASRRLDAQLLMLTEIIDEEPPAPPQRDTTPEPPPPPAKPAAKVQRAEKDEFRDPTPPPQERGFRRGRRRKTREVGRELGELERPKAQPPPAGKREAVPQRAEKPRAEGRSPIADSRLPIADSRLPIADSRLPIADRRAPIADRRGPGADRRGPRPDLSPPDLSPPDWQSAERRVGDRRAERPRHLAATPPISSPHGWSPSDPNARTTDTERFALADFAGDALTPPRQTPSPLERADSEIIQPVARHSGPHPLVIFAVTLAICLALLVILAPPGSHGVQERVVTVPGGASASTIGNALAEAHLVRSSAAFSVIGELSRTRGLRAGSYRVRTGLWPWQVATELRAGEGALLDVVIPEGSSLTEIAKRLQDAGVSDAVQLTEAAHAPQLLSRYGIVAIDAQGWLAPGAYAMARGITPVDAVGVMIERFKAQLAALPETATLSAEALNQVMVLGSLVEKEAKDKTEARRIAGLFHNRLKLGMRLESRATVLYILGVEKKELTLADVRQPSPYNTYLNAGLPPGPIATPGLDALRAALHPEEHGYFYMTDRDEGAGGHVFSITYEEHLKAQRENR